MEFNEKNFNELSEKVEHLEKKLKGIEARLDTHENELDQIREVEIAERPLY